VAAFSPLLDMLAEVPDPRRAEGKLYQLPHVLLFSILAIVTGCNSYRGIVTFIEVHRRKLNTAFGLNGGAHPRTPRSVTSSRVWIPPPSRRSFAAMPAPHKPTSP